MHTTRIGILLAIVCTQSSAGWSQTTHFGLHSAGTDRTLFLETGAESRRQILNWHAVQPSPAEYQLDVPDRLTLANSQAGVDIVYTLRVNSQWATEVAVQPGEERNYDLPDSAPINMDDWREYVSTLVERYDGDGIDDVGDLGDFPVKHWQLGNEFLAQWDGTNEQFVDLMRVTYDTIKSADPDANVLTPGLTATHIFSLKDGFNDRGWTYHGANDFDKQMLTADDLNADVPQYDFALQLLHDAKDAYDIVDFHLYASSTEEVEYSAAWLRHQLDSAGGEDKLIWSTEFAAPFFDWTEAEFGRSIITSQVTAFGNGVDRVFWSSLFPTTGWSESYQQLALVDQQGNQTAAYHVYSLLTDQIGGFETVTEIEAADGQRTFDFTFANSGNVTISWDEEGIDFAGARGTFRLSNSILAFSGADCSGNGSVDLFDANCVAADAIDGFLELYGFVPGDADGDNRVAFSDFLVLSTNFGLAGDYTDGDFDRDGMVGFSDFLRLATNFGAARANVSAATPEPAGYHVAWLLVIGSLALRRRR